MKEKTAIRTAIHTLDLVAHVYNVLATLFCLLAGNVVTLCARSRSVVPVESCRKCTTANFFRIRTCFSTSYRFFCFLFFFLEHKRVLFWCTDLILLLSFPLIGCTLDVKNAPQFRFPIEFAYYAFRSVDSILYSRGVGWLVVCVCVHLL
jgi:hypothetical protein